MPDGDATLTLSLNSGANDVTSDLSEFEACTVDVDRIAVLCSEGTDDATVGINDAGLDLTALPEGGKTYFEEQPFPSGDYTGAEIHFTVDEARGSDGDVTFGGESPATVELGISEE